MQQNELTDLRVVKYVPLISPYQLQQDIPRSEIATETVRRGRHGIEDILGRRDYRKIIITGPCSIHDPGAAIEYATLLRELPDEVSDQFLIVMRTYFEKPRTAIGWEGLIIDPDLDGSEDVNKGYHLSRKILLEVSELGLPCATEYLESFTPQYNSDLVSWAAIGARTANSPQHRKMASGLSMPVGIKNDTHGDVDIAVNGVLYARSRHSFAGINMYAAASVVKTSGNPYAHLVLRGGGRSPNYDAESVRQAQSMLESKGIPPNVVIDCSHGNSGKDYNKQPAVFEEAIRQIRDGNQGIIGIMVESNLKAGNQRLPDDLAGFDKSDLFYGISVTDGCIDWETTRSIIMDACKTLARTR